MKKTKYEFGKLIFKPARGKGYNRTLIVRNYTRVEMFGKGKGR